MLNTAKRDERRAKKALFESLLSKHHMIANMKEEIAQLKYELKRSHADQDDADKNKGFWQAYMINKLSMNIVT